MATFAFMGADTVSIGGTGETGGTGIVPDCPFCDDGDDHGLEPVVVHPAKRRRVVTNKDMCPAESGLRCMGNSRKVQIIVISLKNMTHLRMKPFFKKPPQSTHVYVVVGFFKSRSFSIGVLSSNKTTMHVKNGQDPTQNDVTMPEALYNFTDIQKITLKSGLYLVATPIGNLRDITLRAIDTLAAADMVACEDTRVSGKLFGALGFKQKLIAYHDHNADMQRPYILSQIAEGKSVALISDAGMPLISDPGYKLVRDCLEAGVYVTSLPGANSPLMALQLSGLPSDNFTFIGFLPSKSKARCDVLEKWKSMDTTLIVFESAARLEDSCSDILATLGDRPMTLTRELTKKFEDVWPSTVSGVLERLKKEGAPKGEIVLVIGRSEQVDEIIDLDKMILSAIKTTSIKEAVADIVAATGLPKKQVYNRALELRDAE